MATFGKPCSTFIFWGWVACAVEAFYNELIYPRWSSWSIGADAEWSQHCLCFTLKQEKYKFNELKSTMKTEVLTGEKRVNNHITSHFKKSS